MALCADTTVPTARSHVSFLHKNTAARPVKFQKRMPLVTTGTLFSESIDGMCQLPVRLRPVHLESAAPQPNQLDRGSLIS